jgi:hypothetical protein
MPDEYRIIMQPEAISGMEDAYRWIRRESGSVEIADTWLDGIVDEINSLSFMPTRCHLAEENDAFDVELRVQLYGKRSGTYRILFTIDADAVHVIYVRHGARARLFP